MSIERVSRSRPCPICSGSPELPYGAGVRCWGGVGGDFAYCTREQHAGKLELHDTGAYRHRIRCRCASGCMCAARGRRTPGCFCAEHCTCCGCGEEHGRGVAALVEPQPQPSAAERSTEAREIFGAAARAAGTLVERYLRARGIVLPPPPSLRFAVLCHAPTRRKLPGMVAAVQDVERRVVAVHRTFLAADGSSRIDRRMLGPVRGAAVRLAGATDELAIAEGIESALAYQQATGRPTWAAMSASGMRAIELPPLPLAARVWIAADHDAPGLNAAEHLASRLFREGRQVRIAKPPLEGHDWNDVLRGAA